jgi:hypothetical protein
MIAHLLSLSILLLMIMCNHKALSIHTESPVVKTDVLLLLSSSNQVYSTIPILDDMKQQYNVSITILVTDSAQLILFDSNQPHQQYIQNTLSLTDDTCIQMFKNGSIDESNLISLLKQVEVSQFIITGMTTIEQYQITEAYVKKNDTVRVIGYFDEYIWSLEQQLIMNEFASLNTKQLQQIWVTSEIIKQSVTKTHSIWKEIIVNVGNPSIHNWRYQRLNHTNNEIISSLSNELHYNMSSKPIISFAGGYGIEYQDSVRSFLAACEGLQLLGVFNIVIALDIRSDSTVEIRVLKDLGLTLNQGVFVLPWTFNSLVHLSLVSQFVVSYDSTANVNSLFFGIPSVFYQSGSGLPSPDTINTALEQHLSYLATNATQFGAVISTLRHSHFVFNTTKLQEAGIPSDPLSIIRKQLSRFSIVSVYGQSETLYEIKEKKLAYCPMEPLTHGQILAIGGITLGIFCILIVIMIISCAIRYRKKQIIFDEYEPLLH